MSADCWDRDLGVQIHLRPQDHGRTDPSRNPELPLSILDRRGLMRATIDATVCLVVNEAPICMVGASTKKEMLGLVGWVWPAESEDAFAKNIIAYRMGVDRIEFEHDR